MTLSSRHRIRNSSPDGLRPNTLPLGHGGSPQWLSHVDGEETFFVSFKPPRPGTECRTLAWKAAVLTTTLGLPPFGGKAAKSMWLWPYITAYPDYIRCYRFLLGHSVPPFKHVVDEHVRSNINKILRPQFCQNWIISTHFVDRVSETKPISNG